ncbi:MAG: efflux RND transporter periplasmic adaptor subunit, partial [Flavobacteriales bacterium]|nr:efflux RND transporter periplasmic adaptor subunit [Flavobacteriales bacterium]
MKKIIALVSISVIIASCGSHSDMNVDVMNLQQKKDSLKSVYNDIANQIAQIDEQLKAMDTTIQLPLVTTQMVSIKPFSHFVEVQGNVETGGNALVYPEANGTITQIATREGNKVTKGDVILRIDAGMLQSTLKEVETQSDLANQIFEKQERLWKDKIGSEIDYLQAKTNKEALDQKLKTLREQIDMYTVKAPFTGVIDEIIPKIGEAANPMMPVARIINYDDKYIKADISEDYVTNISEGSLAKVFFSSLNKEYEAKVDRTGDYINPNNRTFKIHISLNDIDAPLKPNLLADVRVQDFKNDSAVVIPSSIIQQDRTGNDYIYLLEDNNG